MFRCVVVLYICLCLVLFGSAQQQPTLKLGRTESRVGFLEVLSADSRRSYEAFQAALGSSMNIGGVDYVVQHIAYNDGSDIQLMNILYERLVEVDKVDFLFSPFGLGMDVLRPINSPQNWTWVLSTSTSFTNLAGSCMPAFKGTQMKTYAALTDPLFLQFTDFFATFRRIVESQGYVLASNDSFDVVKDEDLVDNTMDELIAKWKRVKPDLIMTASDTLADLRLIDRMRRQNYNPPLIFFTVGASYLSFRQAAGWKGNGIVAVVDYEAGLNFTDELFGSSQGVQDVWKSALNASVTQTRYAFAGSMLYSAIKAAGTKDRGAVMAQLRNFNRETFCGVITVNPQSLVAQRPTYCLQFSQDGTRIVPVKPSALANAVPLQYPALPTLYPDGFFPKKSKKRTIAIAASICGGVVLLVLIVLAVYLIIRAKYHLVMVPKAANTEEWT